MGQENNHNSTAEESGTASSKKWLKWTLGILGTLLVLLGITYVVSYFVAGNQVPPKAVVAGVRIGGLGPDQAEKKLAEKLGPTYSRDLTLVDDRGRSTTITPSKAGLAPDFAQTVVAAGGRFSWNPVDIYRSFTGGQDTPIAFTVDHDALTKALQDASATFESKAKDATVTLEGAKPSVTKGEDTTTLDVEASAKAVETAYRQGADRATVALQVTPPTVTTEAAEKFVAEQLAPAVSGPVTVKAGKASYQITPEQIAAALSPAVKDGHLDLGLDLEKLWKDTAKSRESTSLTKAKNAGYQLSNGGISVTPSAEGITVSEESIKKGLPDALTKQGDQRVIQAETTVQKPTFTTSQAESLKPTKVIGEFTTYYPHAAYRNTNIGKAAAHINGTVLLPGQTFSFNDVVGERTPARGFVDGYIINGGNLQKASGGGVSQAATTTFNAAFFAGFEDVEHHPHGLYFPRYPAGREATVAWGSLDLKFKNNTQYPALVQAFINPSTPGSKGSITVKIWSRPTWDKVTSSDIQRSNYTTGRDRVVRHPRCEPQEPIQGFTARYSRNFWKGGKIAKTEHFKWRYDAGDRITCG